MPHPTSLGKYRPHPHLYEINTWAWLHELSRKKGKEIRLSQVPEEEWDDLQSKGFDFIWLMGIWERSPISRQIAQTDPHLQQEYDKALPTWGPELVTGSPYSIKAYSPDPKLATWDQLDEVRDTLHQRGMKLILDFVPNHTALDHEWVDRHPEYYIQGTKRNFGQSPSSFCETIYLAHGKDPYFPAWTDTVQLNYFNPDTRTAMLGELRTIGQHCDGVRCDMAMLILNDVFGKTWGDLLGGTNRPASEFWTEAIMALPELVWIAEVYWDLEWSLQQLGFQFTYDRRLYDRLRKLLPGEIVLHLKADFSYQSRLVRFLENHDEPRSATVFGKACLPAISTLMATLPGMRLYHQGQLEGRTIRHPVQLCMATEEPLDQEAGVFYKRLLRITNEEVFHNGQWKLVTMHSTGDSTFENLVAYQWKGDSVWKIVVVNLSPLTSQGRLYLWNILKTNCQSSHSYVFHDQLNDQVYERHQEDLVQDGLYVSLNPFGAHVFAVSS